MHKLPLILGNLPLGISYCHFLKQYPSWYKYPCKSTYIFKFLWQKCKTHFITNNLTWNTILLHWFATGFTYISKSIICHNQRKWHCIYISVIFYFQWNKWFFVQTTVGNNTNIVRSFFDLGFKIYNNLRIHISTKVELPYFSFTLRLSISLCRTFIFPSTNLFIAELRFAFNLSCIISHFFYKY